MIELSDDVYGFDFSSSLHVGMPHRIAFVWVFRDPWGDGEVELSWTCVN